MQKNPTKTIEISYLIYINNKGWIEAKDILENDEVLLYNNIIGIVIKKELQILDHYETTYNFEVEDNHNYYVSDENVLVHNKCTNSDKYVETVDDALDEVENHLGKSQSYYVNSSGETEFHILVSDADSRKIARFDLDLSKPHVIKEGVHINLETYKYEFGSVSQKKAIKTIHLKWRK